MKWDQSIEKFLRENQYSTKMTTTDLVNEYYRTRGVDDSTSTKEYLIALAEDEIPNWTLSFRLIKKYRKLS